MPTPSEDTTITVDTNELLMSQFRYKPNIAAVLQTWTDKIQEVYDDYHDLMTETLYSNAEGFNLLRYASILGLVRQPLEDDYTLRERIVGEIMRRSSDGTPDRIRQIIEATTGMKKSRYFEHCSTDQLDRGNMGAFLIYGYQIDTGLPMDIKLINGLFLKRAAPATTGSVCLGVARSEESVFIPSEIINLAARLGVFTMEIIENEHFERAGFQWTTSGDGVSFVDDEVGQGQIKYEHASEIGGWHQQVVWEHNKPYLVSIGVDERVPPTTFVQCRLGSAGDWVRVPSDGSEVLIQEPYNPDPTVYFRAGAGGGGAITLDWVSLIDNSYIPERDDLDFLGIRDPAAPFLDDYMGYRADNISKYGPNWENGLASELLNYSTLDFYVDNTQPDSENLLVDSAITVNEIQDKFAAEHDFWPGFSENGYSLESSTYYQGDPTD